MSITIAKSLADHKLTSRSNTRRALAGLAASLALGLFVGATQASASDDFRAGFESELGRITAHHVATVGSLLLFGIPTVHTVQHVYREPVYRPHHRCGHAAGRAQCKHWSHHPRHKRAHAQQSRRDHRHDQKVAHQQRGDRHDGRAKGHDDRRHDRGQRERENREGKTERRGERNLAFRY